MVDFRKKLGGSLGKQPLDPLDIYERLDRESDKGPLRPAQDAVLKNWHTTRRADKDVIVKLHTGQGKTLIGLLILQSKLNEKLGPALYLCPDNFLVDQTARQAKQFGFEVSTAGGGDELPAAFLESKSILITSVHKLFNGLTKFGLHGKSQKVGTIVIDDVHACIDAIRDACTIRLKKESQAYADLVGLFGPALESQGQGTYADLVNGDYDALLPVPYWDWIDHTPEVARILSRNAASNEIKFSWPLIKDMLPDCDCLVSGTGLEILPRLPPLTDFGSYDKAAHRLFMSATVSDDSFLIKGMGLSANTIQTPLTFPGEKWSGEKMVLIPSRLSDTLDRSALVERFAKPVKERPYGVVALVPSFKGASDWKEYGAALADKDTIERGVARLRNKEWDIPLVVANRYDGIDLPDTSCRILILDSRPRGESLLDRHQEKCLADTDVVAAKTARTIEQGMGRSVRGEKDYSVVLLIGSDLVSALRSQAARKFLSSQTQKQVEIGLAIADFAKEDIQKGEKPIQSLVGLIRQCLNRDDGWKDYYVDQMNNIIDPGAPPKHLEAFALELKAEQAAREGRYEDAAKLAQDIADGHAKSDAEKGWYLQERGRHLYRSSKVESEKIQTIAHRKNRFLLRPRTRVGTTVPLKVEQRRVEKVIEFIGSQVDAATLSLTVDALLLDLRFGVEANDFEAAFDKLGKALGFACERPDKEWKEGPDNHWVLRDNLSLIVECKSEVGLQRAEIEKRETDQINRAYAWFTKTYPNVQPQCVMIIPPKKLARGAGLLQSTSALNDRGLKKLSANVRAFFGEFDRQDLKNLSTQNVQEALEQHRLGVEDLLSHYTVPIKDAGSPKS